MHHSLLESLLKPSAYAEPVSSVIMLQTHVSWILLTDYHAWKIKKPVNFGFLDFSTIEKRRFYCQEEVRLNRRLCPDIYEGVIELRETSDGGVAFHGYGRVIDYAVRMKRLPADKMLDRLVDNNEVGLEEMRALARVIADFHRSSDTSSAISEYGNLEHIRFNWQENFAQVIQFENSTLPLRERKLLTDWIHSFMQEHETLFQDRVNNGYIRECNGDIHLENICFADSGMCIFDCIEFNERFRCCDTASDIAFLLMDLDLHERRDLAEELLSTYQNITGDTTLGDLIDFYKIYRAFVRGKVESFRLNDSGISEEEKEIAFKKAIKYFRLALGYIQRLSLKPTLFITCGLMGCGKSTLAAELAFELGLKVYSSDSVRKTNAGIPVTSSQFDTFGEGLYSAGATASVYDELFRLAKQELASGRSVIIDASFIRYKDRLRFATLAAELGIDFLILYFECNEAENLARLQRRFLQGNSISDGRPELLESQRLEFERPQKKERTVVVLDAAKNVYALINDIYCQFSKIRINQDSAD